MIIDYVGELGEEYPYNRGITPLHNRVSMDAMSRAAYTWNIFAAKEKARHKPGFVLPVAITMC